MRTYWVRDFICQHRRISLYFMYESSKDYHLSMHAWVATLWEWTSLCMHVRVIQRSPFLSMHVRVLGTSPCACMSHLKITTYLLTLWNGVSLCVHVWVIQRSPFFYACMSHRNTGWQWLIGSPKLQIIFNKRATKYRSLLRKMTYKDKGSYESSPPCSAICMYGSYKYGVATTNRLLISIGLFCKRAL